MESIAMAVITPQPATDAKQTTAVNTKAGAGGIFGLLMAQEINSLPEAVKALPQNKPQAGSLVALWLMSALAQGIGVNIGKQAQETQPAEGGLDLPQTAGTVQAEQPDAHDMSENMADAAAALLQWITANPEQFRAIVADLKASGKEAAGLVEALGSAIPDGMPRENRIVPMIAHRNAEFTALNQTLVSDEQQTAETPIQENGKAALAEIKRLFAQAISELPEGRHKTVQAAGNTADLQPQANAGLLAATSAVAPDSPATQDAPVTLDAPVAPDAPANGAAVAQPASAAQQSAEPGEGDQHLDTPAGKEYRQETAPADKKETEQLPFQAAMRAYHIAAPAVARGEAARMATVHAAAQPGAEAFESVVQSITGLKDSGAKELQIQLKPEFLGKVTISLAMDEGGLVAKIAAANPRVQDAFLNQAASLQSVLADQGLKDVRVVVTSSSVQDPNLQQQADRRSQNQQQPQKRHRLTVHGVENAAAPALQAYEALYQTNAVNYLA